MTEKAPSKAKATKPKADAGFNFERSIEQLETLVAAMEDGELSLEDSLEAFEKGIKLTRECQSALRQAEQKVLVLMDESGTTQDLTLEDETDENPFESDTSNLKRANHCSI